MNNELKTFLEEILTWPQFTIIDEELKQVPSGRKDILRKKIVLQNEKTCKLGQLKLRGVTRAFLEKQFVDAGSDETFYSYLFFYGEKGAHFRSEVDHALEDCSDAMLKKILDALSADNEWGSYFQKDENRLNFISGVAGELDLRNYYLAYLHQKSINESHSIMLSTTTDPKTAKQFSKDTEHTTEELIMLLVDIFKVNEHFSTVCWDDVEYQEIIRKKLKERGLPIFKDWPYPSEHETSILAGILPHYLWAVSDQTNKRIIVNPYLYCTDIADPCLRIDQKNFEERGRKENRNKIGFIFLDGKYSTFAIS